MSAGRLFELGMVVAAPGALEATTHSQLRDMLRRHLTGDWGNVCPSDKQLNDQALQHGDRLLSAYPIDPAKPSKGHGANTLWIITVSDRSATTFLLPDEY